MSDEEKIDGKLYDTGSGRWCASCKLMHGCLYNCEKYPEEIRNQISTSIFNIKNDLRSGRLKGPPKILLGIEAMKIFSGIKNV